VAQSEPEAKSPSALSKGARFCARLLVFKGLGSFFCNFKMTPKYNFTLFYSDFDRGASRERLAPSPNDLPMTAVARSMEAIDCQFSCQPPSARKAACFRSLAKARVSASFAVGSGSRSR
jgi:hypothetical protein